MPINKAARAIVHGFYRPVLGYLGLIDPIIAAPDWIAATRERIGDADGQPHRDDSKAGHMVQGDIGADLAGHIAEWMHATSKD